MLVKIKDIDKKWVMFDNAEEVELDNNPVILKSSDDLLEFDPADGVTQFRYVLPEIELDEIGKKGGLKVLILRFSRQRIPHVVVFNRLAYICNDYGKTIEKASCEHGWT